MSDFLEGCSRSFTDLCRRSQELRRNFKSLSVLGLATTTMSTWVALLLANAFSLTNGGLAGTVWVYLATWICTFALAASLAEMASMAPTSGGQYRELGRVIFFGLEKDVLIRRPADWVSEFAPKKLQKALSYIIGMVHVPSKKALNSELTAYI